MSNIISSEIINAISGKLLAKYRNVKGITQRQLAHQSNISQSHVAKMEVGDRTVSLVYLINALPYLDTNINFFIKTFDETHAEFVKQRHLTKESHSELAERIIDKLF